MNDFINLILNFEYGHIVVIFFSISLILEILIDSVKFLEKWSHVWNNYKSKIFIKWNFKFLNIIPIFIIIIILILLKLNLSNFFAEIFNIIIILSLLYYIFCFFKLFFIKNNRKLNYVERLSICFIPLVFCSISYNDAKNLVDSSILNLDFTGIQANLVTIYFSKILFLNFSLICNVFLIFYNITFIVKIFTKKKISYKNIKIYDFHLLEDQFKNRNNILFIVIIGLFEIFISFWYLLKNIFKLTSNIIFVAINSIFTKINLINENNLNFFSLLKWSKISIIISLIYAFLEINRSTYGFSKYILDVYQLFAFIIGIPLVLNQIDSLNKNN